MTKLPLLSIWKSIIFYGGFSIFNWLAWFFTPEKKKEIKRKISGLTEKRRFFAFSLGEIFKGYHVRDRGSLNITSSDTLIMIFHLNIKQYILDKTYRCSPTVDFLDQNYKKSTALHSVTRNINFKWSLYKILLFLEELSRKPK